MSRETLWPCNDVRLIVMHVMPAQGPVRKSIMRALLPVGGEALRGAQIVPYGVIRLHYIISHKFALHAVTCSAAYQSTCSTLKRRTICLTCESHSRCVMPRPCDAVVYLSLQLPKDDASGA